MADDPRIDEVAAIADRRTAPTTSQSEGVRLLDRLARLFGAPHETASEATVGALFLWGPLEVRRPLGSGSFGDVYAAWDSTLQREVALKLRSPEVGTLRWLDEARNLARIRHSNVLTVHGADVLNGRAGIWTELIAGHTLEDELVASGPFAESEVVRIGRDIASALAAVHDAGLVHGDVKTHNIMLENGDSPRRAVLVDFGSADRPIGNDDIPAYTIGTPLTMAPEVLAGRPASASSDVYGLGATLFRLVTARYPVEATSIDELKRAHASQERVNVRAAAPQVSARFARALERALEIDPAQRWPSADAFRRALDDVADPTRRIRVRAAAVGAGIVAIAAIGSIVFMMTRPGPGPISKGRLSKPQMPNLFRESWHQSGDKTRIGFGWVVAAADLDGDGRSDIVAAEPQWTDGAGVQCGRALAFCGTPAGPDSTRCATWVGDKDNNVGSQIAEAGDVNADGFEDLLIAEIPPGTDPRAGRVRLYLGGQRVGAIVPSWTVVGQSRESAIGSSMSAAGDVNHDGYDDVLVGEPAMTDSLLHEGIVRLYTGSATGLSPDAKWRARGGQAGASMGGWMSRLGDVNGDGFDDVLVAANTWDGAAVDCGQARVFLGGGTGVAARPTWTFDGASPNSHLGTMVSGAGDVNGDGYDDALIGEPQYSEEDRPERGRALIFFGGPGGPSPDPDWVALGLAAYSHLGYYVLGIGDVDADGYDDVAIVTSQYTEGERIHLGMVEVYRGGKKGCESTAAWRTIGGRADCHLGHTVAAGDFNGDHIPDLVVCAPLCGDPSPELGLLITYLGQRSK